MPRTPDNLDLLHSLETVASTIRGEVPEDVEQLQAEQHQAEELNLGTTPSGPTSLDKLLQHTDPLRRPQILDWVHRKKLGPDDPIIDVHAEYAGLLNDIRGFIQQLVTELENQQAASGGVMHYAQLQHDLAATIKRRTEELRDLDGKLQDSTSKGHAALTEVVNRAAFRGTLKAGALLLLGQLLLVLVIFLTR